MNYLVVVNDPGGANVLLSYITKNFKSGNFEIINKGPVDHSLFIKNQIRFKEITISESIINIENKYYTAVFTGTGLGDLEYFITAFARVKGIHVAAALDHWVNYEERFTRYGETIVPTEIWVSDDKALLKAADIFKNKVPIRKIDNTYVEDTVNYIKNYIQPSNVIYLTQPNVNNKVAIEELQRLNQSEKIYVKPHPKDNTDYSGYNVINGDLKFSLLSAKEVYGYDTMGMHIADLAGIPTYTFQDEITIPRGNIKKV